MRPEQIHWRLSTKVTFLHFGTYQFWTRCMKIFVHEITYIVQMRMYALNANVFSNNELFMRWRSVAKRTLVFFLPINFLKVILLHVHMCYQISFNKVAHSNFTKIQWSVSSLCRTSVSFAFSCFLFYFTLFQSRLKLMYSSVCGIQFLHYSFCQ